MSHPRRLVLSSVVAALLLAGCVSALPLSSVTVDSAATATGAVSGRVAFPTSLAQQANIIPTGIGSVITAGAHYTLQATVDAAASAAADPDLPVFGAWVVALDPGDRHRLPGVAPVHTDATGHFELEGAPTGNVLVAAIFRSADDQHAYRLFAVTRGGSTSSLVISWRSTAVVAALGADEARQADPAVLAERENMQADWLGGQSPEARLAALEKTLGVDPALVPGTDASPDPNLGEALPLPAPLVLPTATASGGTSVALPSSLPGGLPLPRASNLPLPQASLPLPLGSSLPQPVASVVALVTNTLPAPVASVAGALTQTLAQTTQTAGNAVTQTVGAVLGGVTGTSPTTAPVTSVVTGVVNQLSSVLSAPTPAPTTAPTATPAPLLPILKHLL